MAHYAFLDDDNMVTEVIVGIDETELVEGMVPETWYAQFRGQRCIRTSYNGTIRKHYAGIGFTYHEDIDAFVPPKCHKEAILNQTNAVWECANIEHEVSNAEID